MRFVCQYCGATTRGGGFCNRSPTGGHVIFPVEDGTHMQGLSSSPPPLPVVVKIQNPVRDEDDYDRSDEPRDDDSDANQIAFAMAVVSFVGGAIVQRYHPIWPYLWIAIGVGGSVLSYLLRKVLLGVLRCINWFLSNLTLFAGIAMIGLIIYEILKHK